MFYLSHSWLKFFLHSFFIQTKGKESQTTWECPSPTDTIGYISEDNVLIREQEAKESQIDDETTLLKDPIEPDALKENKSEGEKNSSKMENEFEMENNAKTYQQAILETAVTPLTDDNASAGKVLTAIREHHVRSSDTGTPTDEDEGWQEAVPRGSRYSGGTGRLP